MESIKMKGSRIYIPIAILLVVLLLFALLFQWHSSIPIGIAVLMVCNTWRQGRILDQEGQRKMESIMSARREELDAIAQELGYNTDD